MNDDDTRQQQTPEGHDAVERPAARTYSRPVLTEYGSVARMTQGGTSQKGDKGGSGGFRDIR